MKAPMRNAFVALGLAAALSAAPAAFAQTATETPGGSLTPSTGAGVPLTAGTGAATFGGGSIDEEPLAHTGGGDLAFAAGSLVAAGGLGLRLFALRRG
ncbi:MAG TPA: hypothetical protein VGK50_01535 [Coriobacteriia bacterium]|jgi:hypothetical protein